MPTKQRNKYNQKNHYCQGWFSIARLRIVAAANPLSIYDEN